MMTPIAGIYHTYSSSPLLTAFQHSASPTSSSTSFLLFVGGLNDGPLTVAYTPSLAQSLPSSWSLVELKISSSFHGWGEVEANVGRDAREVRMAVEYFERLGGGNNKVVLMGHSTGCQDLIAYAQLFPSAHQPIILQAPVSDREYLLSQHPHAPLSFPHLGPRDLIPAEYSTAFGEDSAPICNKRWMSLIQKGEGEVKVEENEDFFSTDLDQRRVQDVWSSVNSPLLVLCSERDEAYPEGLVASGKIEKMIGMWKEVVGEKNWSTFSGLLRGAGSTHVPSEEARFDMIKRVLDFLSEVSS